MAEAEGKDMNDEEWLYGGEDKKPEVADAGGGDGEGGTAEDKSGEEGPASAAAVEDTDDKMDDKEDEEAKDKNGNEEGDESEEDEDDSDDDDDGVQVVITAGQTQTPFGGTGAVSAMNKRAGPPPDKKGKFSVEDFETPGIINGVSALEFSIDGIEDKPWRKPGADITDYFNYGFTEETWRAYTERQKRMRFESGGPQIVMPLPPKQQPDGRGVINVAFGGPPPNMQHQRMDMMMRRREEPRENTIQVMTADRREYSRKNFEMMGMGGPPMPPSFNPAIPPPNFPPPGPEFMNPDFYHPPPHEFYPEEPGYDQEQWMDHHTETWDMGMAVPPQHSHGGASTIVSLTKVSNVPPPPGDEDVKHERQD